MELPTTTTTVTTTTTTTTTTIPKHTVDPSVLLNETTPLLRPESSNNDDNHVDHDEEHDPTTTTTTTTPTEQQQQQQDHHNMSGTFQVGLGAAFFAATNAAATALYRRNGVSVVSLYMIRSPLIYVANAILVFFWKYPHDHHHHHHHHAHPPPPAETAMDVLLLRTRNRSACHLALLRSFLNAIKQVLLSVGFVFMTYADAFCIFKGVAVVGTILVARLVGGRAEQLHPFEVMSGLVVLGGITCIIIAPLPSSPSSLLQNSLFGILLADQYDENEDIEEEEEEDVPEEDFTTTTATTSTTISTTTRTHWVPHPTAGVLLVIMAGLLSAFSGTLMRLLSAKAGPHKATPSMLLSYLMVLFFLVNTFVMLFMLMITRTSSSIGGSLQEASSASAWAWTTFLWPHDTMDWCLIALNCICTLGGHLATATGYQTTRAGMVALLQLTEIPWVYFIDVGVLGESTTPLKTWGSMIVFGSAVMAAIVAHHPPSSSSSAAAAS